MNQRHQELEAAIVMGAPAGSSGRDTEGPGVVVGFRDGGLAIMHTSGILDREAYTDLAECVDRLAPDVRAVVLILDSSVGFLPGWGLAIASLRACAKPVISWIVNAIGPACVLALHGSVVIAEPRAQVGLGNIIHFAILDENSLFCMAEDRVMMEAVTDAVRRMRPQLTADPAGSRIAEHAEAIGLIDKIDSDARGLIQRLREAAGDQFA